MPKTATKKIEKAVEKTPAVQPVVVRRQLTGEVMTAPKQKTVSVRVKSIKMHPKYRKQYSVSKKYAVHDEKNEANVGDVVVIEECRPLSKTKRWRIVTIQK